MNTAEQLADTLPNLYSTTGNVLDINTLLINRAELRRLSAENEALRDLLKEGWVMVPEGGAAPQPAPSVDWQNIGALMEAHSKAKAAGLIGGTTSWGAFVAREMLKAPQPAAQDRPSFAEWTSDYARDNLHKLKAQPAAQPTEPVGFIVATRWNAADEVTRYEASFRPTAKIKAGDMLYTNPATPPATQPKADAIKWPVMPSNKGQSPVLFEDGYAEGWAKCLTMCQEAMAQTATKPAAQQKLETVNAELLEALNWAYNEAVDHNDSLPFDWAIYCEALYMVITKHKAKP